MPYLEPSEFIISTQIAIQSHTQLVFFLLIFTRIMTCFDLSVGHHQVVSQETENILNCQQMTIFYYNLTHIQMHIFIVNVNTIIKLIKMKRFYIYYIAG